MSNVYAPLRDARLQQICLLGQQLGHEHILRNTKLIKDVQDQPVQKHTIIQPALDQGQSGTCFAHAGMKYLEEVKTDYLIKNGYSMECPKLSITFTHSYLYIDQGEDYLDDIIQTLCDLHEDKLQIDVSLNVREIESLKDHTHTSLVFVNKFNRYKDFYKKNPECYPTLKEKLRKSPGNDGGYFQSFIRCIEKHGLAFEDQVRTTVANLNSRNLQEEMNKHWHAYAAEMVLVYKEYPTQDVKFLKDKLMNLKTTAIDNAKRILYNLMTPDCTVHEASATKTYLYDADIPFPKPYELLLRKNGVGDELKRFNTPHAIKKWIFQDAFTMAPLEKQFVCLVNDPCTLGSSSFKAIQECREERLPRGCHGFIRMAAKWELMNACIQACIDRKEPLWTAIDVNENFVVDKCVGVADPAVHDIGLIADLGSIPHRQNSWIDLCEKRPTFLRSLGFSQANHAVLLVGSGGEKDTPFPFYQILNSWGGEVGDIVFRGEMKLTKEWCQNYMEEVWISKRTLESIIEQLSLPAQVKKEFYTEVQKEYSVAEKDIQDLPHMYDLLMRV